VWPVRCGAVCGYLGLLLVFLVPALRPVAHKLSARLSVLMPLQGLVLLGLSPLAAHERAPDGHAGSSLSMVNSRVMIV